MFYTDPETPSPHNVVAAAHVDGRPATEPRPGCSPASRRPAASSTYRLPCRPCLVVSQRPASPIIVFHRSVAAWSHSGQFDPPPTNAAQINAPAPMSSRRPPMIGPGAVPSRNRPISADTRNDAIERGRPVRPASIGESRLVVGETSSTRRSPRGR